MKNITLLLFLLNVHLIFSQSYELGKVTKEELEEKFHPTDSSAVAAILFNKGKSYFEYNQEDGFILITEVETKIKIYKKEGLNWGNKEIAIYIGDSKKEKAEFSKALTYNLENDKIEKTKLRSEGEFEEETNKYWGKKKIVMPNVKEGSIIEYKYTIRSPFFSTFPDWYFQQTIPVIYSEFTTLIPEYFQYNVYKNGWVTLNETKSSKRKTITINSKERTHTSRYTTSTSFSQDNINYNEEITKYFLENIPAIEEESYVTNIKNYAGKVQHELSRTLFPNTPLKSYSVNWQDVVKSIYDSENFGGELKKTGYFEEDVNKLISTLSSQDAKIYAIYGFVKEKVKWDQYSGIYCDKGVKKAYNERTGNVAEINLMLVAMLRHAGLEANPVLVSTRSNGISIYPSRTAFNYVVAAVEVNGKTQLLDATSKYTTPDHLPYRALNWIGRIIRKDGTAEAIELINKDPSIEYITMMYSLDNEGTVKGKIREQKLGYNALFYRENNNDLSEEIYLEKLEKKRKGVEIEEFILSNKLEIEKPIVETYSFTSNRFVEVIGNRIYFSPMLIYQQTENPFKLEKRNYPIDFDFPYKDTFNINIVIPEGYEIESVPASINMGMAKNYGNFKFNISNNNTTINLACSIEINTVIVPNVDYEILKSFFKEIVAKQSEKIVLKKI